MRDYFRRLMGEHPEPLKERKPGYVLDVGEAQIEPQPQLYDVGDDFVVTVEGQPMPDDDELILEVGDAVIEDDEPHPRGRR